MARERSQHGWTRWWSLRRPGASGPTRAGAACALTAAILAVALLVTLAANAGASPEQSPAAGSQLRAAATLNLTWVRCGGPLGGMGYDIRMQTNDPDTMLVTDANSGAFRSTDGGVTWQPSNSGITDRGGPSGDAIPVFCVTIDPHDDDIVWAGTQVQKGIYRSADGGLSWTELDNGVVESEGITFRGFTVDPRSSDIVYAAAELASWRVELRH